MKGFQDIHPTSNHNVHGKGHRRQTSTCWETRFGGNPFRCLTWIRPIPYNHEDESEVGQRQGRHNPEIMHSVLGSKATAQKLISYIARTRFHGARVGSSLPSTE